MTDWKDDVRRGYDELADDYLDRRSDEAPEGLLADLVEELPDDARVLDAGCGAGLPFTERLDWSFDVVGLDVSRAQLRRARRHVPDASFCEGDMTHLPFADDAFDGVTAFYSVIHVSSEEHPDVFGEFARVLRPGGLALLVVGDVEWEGTNEDWLDADVTMHWSYPDRETSLARLRDAGFTVRWHRAVPDDLGSEHVFVLAERDSG
ncbi:class I SAM-dependent methyltransferase [Halobacteriaceae archaeon GCM10025711]